MTEDCRHIDAYLSGDLPADTSARFAAHVQHCDACSRAIDEQRWIDGLLTSPAAMQLDPVPANLTDIIQHSLAHRAHRNARIAACGLAAAATLLVAAGWLWLASLNPHAPNIAKQTESTPPATANVAAPSQAAFVSNGDTIVVPLESSSPDVSVVQLYPTTDTERRRQRELIVQSTKLSNNGG